MISRRTALAGLGASLVLAPVASAARTAGKVPRVGVLSPGNPPPGDPFRQREGFERGLRELGWTPGRTIDVDYRYAEGRVDRLRELAASFVDAQVDVIVARAGPGIRAAQQATRTIPIVMSASVDPVRDGFVASLARPGGNITGLTLLAEDLDAKQLELLAEAVPRLVRVGILRNARVGFVPTVWAKIEATARALHVDVADFPFTRAEDLDGVFRRMAESRVGAVLCRTDPLVIERNRAQVIRLAAARRLPAIYSFRVFPDNGGLMSYGSDIREIHRRSAWFVDRILRGAKPADLPVEEPTKFELVINLRAAKPLGFTMPQSLLVRADEVIQ